MAGFEPGSYDPMAYALSTAQRRQGQKIGFLLKHYKLKLNSRKFMAIFSAEN
jgi:hypothetical protein